MIEHKLIGFYDLELGTDIRQYQQDFNDFAQHLKDQGFVSDWGLYIRKPHSGYDARPLQQNIFIEISFPTWEKALTCYDYVAADEPPLSNLHRNINQVVKDTLFALYENVS